MVASSLILRPVLDQMFYHFRFTNSKVNSKVPKSEFSRMEDGDYHLKSIGSDQPSSSAKFSTVENNGPSTFQKSSSTSGTGQVHDSRERWDAPTVKGIRVQKDWMVSTDI